MNYQETLYRLCIRTNILFCIKKHSKANLMIYLYILIATILLYTDNAKQPLELFAHCAFNINPIDSFFLCLFDEIADEAKR